MATIYDIAERAGVSGSTVSRALNGSRLVSDAVRQRVLTVAGEIGFEKRNVRRHRERTILQVRLVLPHHELPEQGLFYDLSALIAGLREGFSPTALQLHCELGGPGFVPFPHKKGGDTDAFVFAFHPPDAATVAELRERGIPFVVLNRATAGLPCIASDHAQGMSDLVAHVASGNPSFRPALLTLDSANEVFEERQESLCAALAGRTVALPYESIFRFPGLSDITPTSIAPLAADFDVLFCINDIVGAAVLAALALARIPVPEGCQVTGFDDSPLRALTRPLLTTVSMPVFDFALRAGRRLAREVIEGESAAPLERLRGTLLVGQSTFAHPIHP